MIPEREILDLKIKVFAMLDADSDIDVSFEEYTGVYVSLKNGKAAVGGTEKTDYIRALMLLAINLNEGLSNFEIKEKRHFKSLGFMIDLSRNGVVKVEKLKEIIDAMALCGFNTLYLYMEDVFELPGYPHFGYRRGKYSLDELKEIDEYAYSMGIEAIPSIQTLGHLGQYLRYEETAEFRENDKVLLCGNEKTYHFIEKIIETMRSCFRTNKIQINCDEASGVGLKSMFSQKKYIEPYDIVMKHLERVREICRKYNFETGVCGDLFYGHLGKGYYDFEFEAPTKEEFEKIPDINIIYWDYYHTSYEDYETLFKGHKSFGKKLSFLGGIWIWSGQLPQADFTFKTMEPALMCCLNNNITDVYTAIFGDDGNETNIAFAIPQLLIFSEYCFKGKEYKTEAVYKLSKSLFGVDMENLRALSLYHAPWIEGLPRANYIWPNYMGKKIFYSDILYNMTGTYDFTDILKAHEDALRSITKAGKDTKWEKYFDYARLIFEITIEKMKIMPALRKGYLENDIDALRELAKERITPLIKKYENLKEIHEEQWLNMYKPFGWEELDIRYAGTISRLHYAKRTLLKYINGQIKEIPELSYEFIEERDGAYCGCGGVCNYHYIKSTGL